MLYEVITFLKGIVKSVVRRHFKDGQFCQAKNNGEHVVEVMGNPPCKLAYGFHLLDLEELLL